MSFFEDQEEAWFEGGREWYNRGLPTNQQVHGIPGDFDPYEFWADSHQDHDPKKERFEFACERLKNAGIKFKVCSTQNYHIKVGEWSFWAWTGKIYHPNKKVKEQCRGIANFINLLKSNGYTNHNQGSAARS